MTKTKIVSKTPSKLVQDISQSALGKVIESARRGELVVVVGAGVSVALSDSKIPSWTGLIESGLQLCVTKGKLTRDQFNTWRSHLYAQDIDELLGAAEFMARKLESPAGDLYVRWLQESFRGITPTNEEMSGAIRSIHEAGIPICTLNYDLLLESVTGLPAVLMNNTLAVTEWMRQHRKGIMHLHGAWEVPETCILSIRDYQTTLGNEVRDLIQRSLGSFKRMLFIGCGATFGDPNFSALIGWLRQFMSAAPLQHYALVRESELTACHKDVQWEGFVEPISFGDEYSNLPGFLRDNFASTIHLGALVVAQPTKPAGREVLDNYRRFLIKDCGQMTIEGIKADMDTTKQKFDIERLFVPLSVLPCAPEFPATDPDREEKLSSWLAKNNDPIPFGNALNTHEGIALLALPGGGKTMLLKRLAVAYADPQRRKITADLLPQIDLFPVLIRCREWRDHIRSPILTLLKNLQDITGQANLAGLADAILPLLREGKVLLLVDGLDEIHNDADRTTFVEHLESFLDEFPSIRLVVTSREAGFSLVAPCLNRFCRRFRVAPLNSETITLLCQHWHLLMTGAAPESMAEANALAEHMVETTALRRLAENPLLLTMLLVVKHGAGRLPPDRVSLYGRAVEVLLDTWNIKGHDALNLKEAIPQLACVAFELMREGKQTATESELLSLLEDARSKIPQIGRYAKDTPYEFLKRVELRSSLLLEAGHQIEAGQAVPFYQFRHLTFQEYLAAVAAANGHFIGYQTKHTVLDPLKSFLVAEEWKEVLPMAAVLAGKQAESLIAALVTDAKELKRKLFAEEEFEGRSQWLGFPSRLPSPVGRLAQCLIEEAEASQEILPDALQLIAIFARGCRSEDDWKLLVRGPYGTELLHQAWNLYDSFDSPVDVWARNTCAALGAHRFSLKHWKTIAGKEEVRRLIQSDNRENAGMGLLTMVGIVFSISGTDRKFSLPVPRAKIEEFLFQDDQSLWHASAWLWGLHRMESQKKWVPTARLLDRILILWDKEKSHHLEQRVTTFVFSNLGGLPRDAWTPKLTEEQRLSVFNALSGDLPNREIGNYHNISACVIAFHARNILSDAKLAKILVKIHTRGARDFNVSAMLGQMGKSGQKLLPLSEENQNPR